MKSETYIHLQGTYTPLRGTELSTPQGGIEHNPGFLTLYRG